MINIGIIDDDVRFSNGLKIELERFQDIQSIVISNSGLKFVQDLEERTAVIPDVILMDIAMSLPDEGIHATAIIRKKFPSIKVVMLTISETDDKVFSAIKAGAVGYLLKDEKPEFILKTILDVYNGGAQMSPSIAKKALDFLRHSTHAKVKSPEAQSLINQQKLSERELQILEQIAKGFTYKLVADNLFISFETVKKHMSNIYQKLEVTNKIDALRKKDGLL